MLDCSHFTNCIAETSGSAPWATLASTAAIGLLLQSPDLSPITFTSMQPISIHLSMNGATVVAPSVVLLDNHTTTWIEKLVESYGWKWENQPPTIEPWRGYYANYVEKGFYSIATYPFRLLYGGYVYLGSIYNAGANGAYWTSTTPIIDQAYYLDFNSVDIYPSGDLNHSNGFSIRCLAR